MKEDQKSPSKSRVVAESAALVLGINHGVRMGKDGKFYANIVPAEAYMRGLKSESAIDNRRTDLVSSTLIAGQHISNTMKIQSPDPE